MILIPILQMANLRLKEVNLFSQGHVAGKFQSQDLIDLPLFPESIPSHGHWALGSPRDYMPRAAGQGLVRDWKLEQEFCSPDRARGPALTGHHLWAWNFARHNASLLSLKPYNTTLQLGLLAPFCR